MHLIMDATTKGIRTSVLEHLDTLAAYTGADIFLLSPKLLDADSAIVSSYGYTTDSGLENRFRVAIYGDMESSEHAKTRLLIMIDQIVCAARSWVAQGHANFYIAETSRGCHEARADDAYPCLWPYSQEHQAH